jgi:hypothetical protein
MTTLTSNPAPASIDPTDLERWRDTAAAMHRLLRGTVDLLDALEGQVDPGRPYLDDLRRQRASLESALPTIQKAVDLTTEAAGLVVGLKRQFAAAARTGPTYDPIDPSRRGPRR